MKSEEYQGIVNLKVVVSGVEEAAEKAQILIDKINEAKALAGELASLCERVDLDSFEA